MHKRTSGCVPTPSVSKISTQAYLIGLEYPAEQSFGLLSNLLPDGMRKLVVVLVFGIVVLCVQQLLDLGLSGQPIIEYNRLATLV